MGRTLTCSCSMPAQPLKKRPGVTFSVPCARRLIWRPPTQGKALPPHSVPLCKKGHRQRWQTRTRHWRPTSVNLSAPLNLHLTSFVLVGLVGVIWCDCSPENVKSEFVGLVEPISLNARLSNQHLFCGLGVHEPVFLDLFSSSWVLVHELGALVYQHQCCFSGQRW